MVDYDWYITPESYRIAEQNGICRDTLETRIRDLGWGTKRAITTPVQKHKSYKKWVELAKTNGICASTFHNRVWRLDMDPELAATMPVMTRKAIGQKVAEKMRIYPKEYVDKAKSNGISSAAFTDRARRGWSLEDAATRPLMSKKESSARGKKKPFSFGRVYGKKTNSIF